MFSILLTNELKTLKIADFGSGRKMDTTEMTNKVGTIVYMAPEVFTSNSKYSIKCDVFSFGITLCEMFTRQKPYGKKIRKEIKANPLKFMRKISKRNSPLRPNLSADVPFALSTLIKR